MSQHVSTGFYKAVGPDGTAFFDGTFRWLRKDGKPYARPVRHPDPNLDGGARGYLSVATEPTACTGMEWPCRLLAVEPVGRTSGDDRWECKVRCEAVRVVAELPAWQAFGPQGEEVAALIERASNLTVFQQALLSDVWDAKWMRGDGRARVFLSRMLLNRRVDIDLFPSRFPAEYAAKRAVALRRCGIAGQDAARALVLRDLISADDYSALCEPWRQVVR